MRLLQNAGGTVTITIYNQEGVAVDATGTPTVVVKNGADATVSSGNATKRAATTGIYDYSITAAVAANLDKYTATWTANVAGDVKTYVSRFEVVGAFYVSIPELRAFDKGLPEASYTAAQIVSARENAEETLEQGCGVSFVPRGKRFTTSGLGRTDLGLKVYPIRRLVSISIDDTVLTSTQLDEVEVENAFAYYPNGFASGRQNVDVYLEHGYDQPPEDVKRAVMWLVRDYLIPTNISGRATSHTDDSGTTQFIVPGEKRPTGNPFVDSVIARYSEKLPAIA